MSKTKDPKLKVGKDKKSQSAPASASLKGQPSQSAIDAAREVELRLKGRRAAPLRRAFVTRRDPADPVPPLARLIRGGHGGSVRLRLYLTFVWVAVAPPHRLEYPARAWATLLDLPQPAANGARRVNDAIAWLESQELIKVDPREGLPSVVTLLSDTGSGEDYVAPGTAWSTARSQRPGDPNAGTDHLYVNLPSTLWTNGWITTLSSTALVMLLVLLVEAGKDQDAEIWFSPGRARQLYDISDDTRSKGLRELAAVGLITTKRASISENVFDLQRLRNKYTLNLKLLNTRALRQWKPTPPSLRYDA